MRLSFVCLIFGLFFGTGFGQSRVLDFGLFDSDTKSPISDAHVFIGNATFGSISDKNGRSTLQIPSDVIEDLVISHISYELKIIKHSGYNTLSENDSIFLNPSGINIDEIVISKERNRKWRKNFKKFRKAFIGDDKKSGLCQILNPEVLRFENEKDLFKVTAVDMLKIKNDYLGYNIDFILDELTIDKNGSMKYVGYPKFTDISHPGNEEEIKKNRKEKYIRSLRHFLINLVGNNLKESNYKLKLVKYYGGEFTEVNRPEPEDIVFLDSLSGLYHLKFNDFLKVTHLAYKELVDVDFNIQTGGIESARFNSISGGAPNRVEYPVSMIYKTSPSLVVNRYGNILNHRNIQEYGFWAEQRMSSQLPFDYGFDFKEEKIEKEQEVKSKVTTLSLTRGILYGDSTTQNKVIGYLKENWKDSHVPMVLDLFRVVNPPLLKAELKALLIENAGIGDYYNGLIWMWEGSPVYDDKYAEVKAEIYSLLDPKFSKYFKGRIETAQISLDEIVWGGVKQDGIPPLRYPTMIPVKDAGYLADTDLIFGIVIDGVAKAYPKRILGWHEFFIDSIGSKDIAGVYCTLCGSMIAYDKQFRNDNHNLGTSGFLYRSNKLMYDKKTQSLWSTIDGEPILGPLANKGIKLNSYPVVTTTWGAWKAENPNTLVLSLDTGYDRNYDEGEAYKAYMSNGNLMFPVPMYNDILENKDEVLIIRPYRYETDPMAISMKYLKKKGMYQDVIADKAIVAIADKNGFARAYYAKQYKFKKYKKGILYDDKGVVWDVKNDSIVNPDGDALARIPSHNVFWFAWYNMYPKTRLIK